MKNNILKVLIIIIFAFVLLTGCKQDIQVKDDALGKQIVIEKSTEQKPQWYIDGFKTSTGTTEYEVGFVERAKTQRSSAQSMAYYDALQRLSNRIETLVINEFASGTEISEHNKDLKENLSKQFANAGIAKGFISDVKTIATYWERAYFEKETESDYFWNYAVLVECPRSKIKEYEQKLRENAKSFVKTQAQQKAEENRDATQSDYEQQVKETL